MNHLPNYSKFSVIIPFHTKKSESVGYGGKIYSLPLKLGTKTRVRFAVRHPVFMTE